MQLNSKQFPLNLLVFFFSCRLTLIFTSQMLCQFNASSHDSLSFTSSISAQKHSRGKLSLLLDFLCKCYHLQMFSDDSAVLEQAAKWQKEKFVFWN